MAEKKNVVEETVEVKTEEQKPVEMTAPATPAENAKPAPQPAPDADKPETDTPKKATKKSPKKAAKKKSVDKSEKDEVDKPAENPKPKFKVSKRDKEMAEKRALLKAAGLSETAIEAAISAQFDTKADKPKANEASTEMFPATFTVHGVKFTKCTLKATKDENGDESYVKSLMLEFANAQQNGTVIAVAIYTPREFIAQKGKSQTSEYERWYGVICPEQLPFDLEMLSIDTILAFHFDGVLMHSMYTEAPSTLSFKTFQKRDKNGAFTALNNFKFEVYAVDFTNKDDKVHGDYIDLFDNK